jgi:hypothetical protein
MFVVQHAVFVIVELSACASETQSVRGVQHAVFVVLKLDFGNRG